MPSKYDIQKKGKIEKEIDANKESRE